VELTRARERLLRRVTTRRGREAEGVVLLEGPHVLESALDWGAVPTFVLLGTESSSDSIDPLKLRLLEAGVEVIPVSTELLEAFAQTDSPQGILGVATEPRAVLPPAGSGSGQRCLVLDGVQDPGNVGTLVRAAAALGADRVVALDGTADPWSAKAVRAAAGLSFAIPIHLLEWEETATWLDLEGLPHLVADRSGQDVRGWLRGAPTGPGAGWALVVGNEGKGPRADVLARATARLAIPLQGGVDSLNVSTAGAILLWALGAGRDPAAGGGGGAP